MCIKYQPIKTIQNNTKTIKAQKTKQQYNFYSSLKNNIANNKIRSIVSVMLFPLSTYIIYL